WSAPSNDRVHAEPEQFLRDADILLGGALGPTIFQPQVLSLNVAKFTKTLAQALDRRERKRRDYTNHHQSCWRSGARRERPRDRAADRRHQFPPSDGDCHAPLPCEVRKGNDTTLGVRCPSAHSPGGAS